MYDYVDGELVYIPIDDISSDDDFVLSDDALQDIVISEEEISGGLESEEEYIVTSDISSDSESYVVESDISSGSDIIYYVSAEDIPSLVADGIELYTTQYNLYPSTAAVNVFEYALNGLGKTPGYFIISGSDTNTAYLYYSYDYEVENNTIYLNDCTLCSYYRLTSSGMGGTTSYYYTIQEAGDQFITPVSSLIYTNLLEGYPDIAPLPSTLLEKVLPWASVASMIICSILAIGSLIRHTACS